MRSEQACFSKSGIRFASFFLKKKICCSLLFHSFVTLLCWNLSNFRIFSYEQIAPEYHVTIYHGGSVPSSFANTNIFFFWWLLFDSWTWKLVSKFLAFNTDIFVHFNNLQSGQQKLNGHEKSKAVGNDTKNLDEREELLQQIRSKVFPLSALLYLCSIMLPDRSLC